MHSNSSSKSGLYNDRVVFNGTDLSELVMCRMGRAIMPDVQNNVLEVGGRHGALFRSNRLSTYTQPVNVWLRCEDRRELSEVRHKLAAALYTDEPKPLYLPDEKGLYYLAVVDGPTDLGEVTSGILGGTVNFLICDPIAYGKKRSVTIASNGTARISAGGTWAALPVATLEAESSESIRIENRTTGEYVEIDEATTGGSLAVGNVYKFDMGLERVFRGRTSYGVTPLSDYFRLEGESYIALENCSGVIEWRERWL